MAKKQYFGIKYPFLNVDYQHFYVDANNSLKDKVRSQLMHIVFTPKGQRLRNPEFGTDLIKYIFDVNDDSTWESVKTEIKDAVSKWASNVTLDNISVVKNADNEAEIYVRLDYTVVNGNASSSDSVVVQV